tara:strand:+ start:1100 stop:1534 length:435 start_codon:yes stop_codon:yes gene_type:complete
MAIYSSGAIHLLGSSKFQGGEDTTSGQDFGMVFRRQSWANSSNLNIGYWAIGVHHCVSFEMQYCWTDWCCHSGGGGIVRGVGATGYGSWGNIAEEVGHYDSHSFSLSGSGNTVYLRCTGGNSNGPNNVYIGIYCNRPDTWQWSA